MKMWAADEVQQLPTRVLQLMESTAVASPGLVRASEAIRQSATATVASMQKAPHNAALTYQFINDIKAYVALSDAMPRSEPFPPTADQQYSELRDDLARIQRLFAAALQGRNVEAAAHDADPANLKRYAAENAQLPPPGRIPRVVFLGETATESWRLNEYFTGRDFLNRGIAGQTSLQMLGRFTQDVISLHPKAVLIFATAADASVTSVQDDLAMMGDLAKAHGIKPLFASILPTGQAETNVQQINRWLQDYCRRENFTYVDFYSAVADSTGKMQARVVGRWCTAELQRLSRHVTHCS